MVICRSLCLAYGLSLSPPHPLSLSLVSSSSSSSLCPLSCRQLANCSQILIVVFMPAAVQSSLATVSLSERILGLVGCKKCGKRVESTRRQQWVRNQNNCEKWSSLGTTRNQYPKVAGRLQGKICIRRLQKHVLCDPSRHYEFLSEQNEVTGYWLVGSLWARHIRQRRILPGPARTTGRLFIEVWIPLGAWGVFTLTMCQEVSQVI